MNNLPAGIITFLFTDIEGSVRLWEEHRDRMLGARARHLEIIEEAVRRHGGQVVTGRGEGDGTFSVFSLPSNALQAACDLQAALGQESWPGEMVLTVRAALHAGAGVPEADNYASQVVNRCSRIRDAAHGGQTLTSEAVHALVRDELPPEIDLQDLGLHRLRDLQRPERVYQANRPDLPSVFPPLRSLDRIATNLPEQRTSFIGREEEQREVAALLGQSRLVTVAGGGGVGKTRLALQVAAERLDQFPDGVWLVDLGSVVEASGVRTAIATVLGLREEPGRDPEQRLLQFLSQREVLLILDNCEHLVEACARLADRVLAQARRVRFLATSREPLGVLGELIYRLQTLPLPGPGKGGKMARGDDVAGGGTGAVEFFLERVSAWKPSIRSEKGILPAVHDICRRLDGIPLALELAAALAPMLDLQEIARRLDDRFTLLDRGVRTAQPRQQTLQAAIDWSYDLLSTPEQTLLGRLALFEGGWTTAGAEAICADHADLPASRVLPLLVRLLDRSLVAEDRQHGVRRHRLLETIREYALQKSRQRPDEHAALETRHTEYFLGLAVDGAAEVRSSGEVAALQRMGAELDNLRAATRRLREGSEPELFVRMTTALYRYLYRRGLWQEAREWLESAEPCLQPESPLAGLLHRQIAVLAMERADDAQAHLEMSLSLSQSSDHEMVETMNLLGLHALDGGQQEQARSWLEQAMAREPGGELRGRVLHNLGLLAARQGRLEEARAHYLEALGERWGAGDRRGAAQTLGGLGSLAHRADDREEARRIYRESLTIRQALDDRFGVAVILNNLGDLAERDGQIDEAVILYLQSRSIFREMQAAAARSPEEELDKLCPGLDPEHLQQLERRAAAEDPCRSGVRGQ